MHEIVTEVCEKTNSPHDYYLVSRSLGYSIGKDKVYEILECGDCGKISVGWIRTSAEHLAFLAEKYVYTK